MSSWRPSASRRVAAAGWLPRGLRGRRRRRDAPGLGGGRASATSIARTRRAATARCSSTTAHGRWSRRALVDGGDRRRGRPRGGDSRCMPVAETLKRVDGDRIVETVERAGLAAAQTPQGARRRLLLDAWNRFPPDRPPAFTDEAALLEACTISVHAIPGEPANLKVTLPDDLSRVERELAGARPAAGRLRPRQPPVRSRARRSASAASSIPGRPGARGSLRRRRRAARGGGRAARCRGDGRPRPRSSRATIGRRARVDSSLLLRDGGRAAGGGRPAPDVDRRHDHRRAAPPREPPRRDARGDRGDGRARRGRGST